MPGTEKSLKKYDAREGDDNVDAMLHDAMLHESPNKILLLYLSEQCYIYPINTILFILVYYSIFWDIHESLFYALILSYHLYMC